jgi:hypothetical protein
VLCCSIGDYPVHQARKVVLASLLMMLVQAAAMIGIIFVSIQDYRATLRGTLWMDRNFFGVLRVKEKAYEPDEAVAYQLVHGITIHGLQFKDPGSRHLTTTYYTESSGVGLAYQNPLSEGPLRVGVLGLGVGRLLPTVMRVTSSDSTKLILPLWIWRKDLAVILAF